MVSSETKKKYQQYLIDLFESKCKLDLFIMGAPSKEFEKPWLSRNDNE